MRKLVLSTLIAFLGLGVGSLPVSVTSEGRARNCYWPMPFRNSARITVTNEGKKMVHAFSCNHRRISKNAIAPSAR
ncbi:MAG: DUF2961 domain-containing protein [Candidatus Hydrogenedentes bacterium]|nr:DUF2961 domain-containing protein [Candidatus Hydrogenedentota bacterium]